MALCLLYGLLLTDEIWLPIVSQFADQKVLIKVFFGTVVSLNFTSTLLHYYYDGFIWKVRHKENRQNLTMAGTAARQNIQQPADPSATAHASWWDKSSEAAPAGRIFLKQLLYFGTPILFIVLMTASVSRSSPSWPLRLATLVMTSPEDQQADVDGAIKAIQRQIKLEEHMQELSPKANHLTYLGDLRYLRSHLVRRRVTRESGTRRQSGNMPASSSSPSMPCKRPSTTTRPAPFLIVRT